MASNSEQENDCDTFMVGIIMMMIGLAITYLTIFVVLPTIVMMHKGWNGETAFGFVISMHVLPAIGGYSYYHLHARRAALQ